MVLTAYVVLSPVTGLFCHRHPRIKVLSLPGRADKTSARLDASVGASGPHDFAVRCNISRPRACDRSQIFRPALRPLARSTLPRPPHPAPNVRDDHDTPLLWDGMARVLEMIWGEWKQKYFCKQDWTGQITLIRFNKFGRARKRRSLAFHPEAVRRRRQPSRLGKSGSDPDHRRIPQYLSDGSALPLPLWASISTHLLRGNSLG